MHGRKRLILGWWPHHLIWPLKSSWKCQVQKFPQLILLQSSLYSASNKILWEWLQQMRKLTEIWITFEIGRKVRGLKPSSTTFLNTEYLGSRAQCLLLRRTRAACDLLICCNQSGLRSPVKEMSLGMICMEGRGPGRFAWGTAPTVAGTSLLL